MPKANVAAIIANVIVTLNFDFRWLKERQLNTKLKLIKKSSIYTFILKLL